MAYMSDPDSKFISPSPVYPDGGQPSGNNPQGGGGTMLTVTDGVHSVTKTTTINITSGATVSDAGGGTADIVITGPITGAITLDTGTGGTPLSKLPYGQQIIAVNATAVKTGWSGSLVGGDSNYAGKYAGGVNLHAGNSSVNTGAGNAELRGGNNTGTGAAGSSGIYGGQSAVSSGGNTYCVGGNGKTGGNCYITGGFANTTKEAPGKIVITAGKNNVDATYGFVYIKNLPTVAGPSGSLYLSAGVIKQAP